MKSWAAKLFVVVCIFFGLPGCGRVIDWGKDIFFQGEDITPDMLLARRHVRSAKVYDEFSTAGIFDVLWLSDEVRTVYATLHARKEARDEDRANTFLRRQIEENRHSLAFYLLVPRAIHLGDSNNSEWSVFLQVGEYKAQPIELKTVELSVEYKAIFGRIYNRFKTVYCLKFDVQDIDGNPIITPETKSMSICFRSVSKQVYLTWQLHNMVLHKRKPEYKETIDYDRCNRCRSPWICP
jgi:hypothetical protein